MAALEWRLRPMADSALDVVRACPAARALPPLVQRLLALRGFEDADAIAAFLQPRLDGLASPDALPDMAAAVARLLRAADARERVVLYGDYDVDGVTSLAILKRVFDAMGIDARTFLPHRMEEGYGLSDDGLRRCLADLAPSLVVAVDCGTSSRRQIAALSAAGIDVIVLDHHEVPPDGPPDCVAVVNPRLGQGFHYLCSAGLAFKLAHALLRARRVPGCDLHEMLDFVALGTVADVVPLIGENRLLVSKGLRQLARTRHPGLQALKSVAGVNGSPKAADIGFRFGPRLNAAGRLDTAQDALDLLLTADPAQAESIARRLDAQNRERQSVQQQIEAEAEAMLAESFDPALHTAIVLGSPAWHPGVVGIVAGKLSRRHHRPVFVIAFDGNGIGKGSGRSIDGISLVRALNACRDIIIAGGGHDMAAGISIRRENLAVFHERLQQTVAQQAGPDALVPRLVIDAELDLADLDFDLLDALEQLEPFGTDNPQPLLCARHVHPAQPPQFCREKHRRFLLRKQNGIVSAIWFNSARQPLPAPPWDVAFTIQRGHFRGQSQLDVYIADIRPAG